MGRRKTEDAEGGVEMLEEAIEVTGEEALPPAAATLPGDLIYGGPAAMIHGIGAFAPGDVLGASALEAAAARAGMTDEELAAHLCKVKGFTRA